MPPATKTATNAAVYGPEHEERLRLITGLRGPEMGPFSIEAIRSILAWIDAGTSPEVAASLSAIPGSGGPPARARARGRWIGSDELADQTGVSAADLEVLTTIGFLSPAPAEPGAEVSFPVGEAAVASLAAELLAHGDVRPADLAPIVELVHELVRYERALLTLATTGLDAREAAARRNRLYRVLHALHTHLFGRMISTGDESEA